VTASFLLIVAGVAGALAYALTCGHNSVWLSSFIFWWVALSCCAGGLLAGLRGGPRVWWPAGQIGVLGGGLVLVLLALIAPESLGLGDLLAYGLLPAGLSCLAALAGANLRATEAGRKNSDEGKSPMSL
jgi:peptidoglycan/LPS O-acetylase OafA/YrhL